MPVVLRRSLHRRWPSWLVNVSAGVEAARRSLLRPSWRLLGAVGYLGFDIAVLGVLFAASGHPIPIDALVLGYIIGYLANPTHAITESCSLSCVRRTNAGLDPHVATHPLVATSMHLAADGAPVVVAAGTDTHRR